MNRPTIELLESVRRIIARWVNTQTPLTADVAQGGTTLSVQTTSRWEAGDELAIIDWERSIFEPKLIVSEVVDNTTLELSTPIMVNNGWTVSQNAVIRKTFDGKIMEGIYIGDPAVIAHYPAISIMENTKSSNWEAISLTKEDHKIQISAFIKASTNEASYRQLLRLTDTIERGLKNNFYPLVGPFDTIEVTAPIVAGDRFIKVADTSLLEPSRHILLDSLHRSEESAVKCVVDATTIEIHAPFSNSYPLIDLPTIIKMTRFFYNSWPSSINYGLVHKGSLLHASTIDYFAWEAEVQEDGGWIDPQM